MKRTIAIFGLVLGCCIAASAGIQLDQGANYARLTGPQTSPNFSTNWTYCTWLKTTVVNPGATYIIMLRASNTYTNAQFLVILRTDNLVHVEGPASTPIVTSVSTVTDGKYHAICVTRDGSNNWTIYIDGAQNATANNAYVQPASTDHINEGADEAGGFTCECSIAESVWYKTRLTLNQIKAYAKGIPPSHIDALHYVGTSNGLYWPLYVAIPSLGGINTDASGGLWNPQQQATQGTYTTVNHCPCSPPAGAEGH